MSDVYDDDLDYEPGVTPCPPWCRFPYAEHGWPEQDRDGHARRRHVVEFGVLEARELGVHHSGRSTPYAGVSVQQVETLTRLGSEYSSVRVSLTSEDEPDLTAHEARQLAGWLFAAADAVEQIERNAS